MGEAGALTKLEVVAGLALCWGILGEVAVQIPTPETLTTATGQRAGGGGGGVSAKRSRKTPCSLVQKL